MGPQCRLNITGKHLKTNCLNVSVCAGICDWVKKNRRGDCPRVVHVTRMHMRTSEVGLGPSETRVPRTGRAGQRGPQQREAAAAQGTRPPGGPQAQALMRTRGPPHPSQDSDLMCLSVISRPPRDTTLTFYVSRGSEPTLPPGMAPAWARHDA